MLLHQANIANAYYKKYFLVNYKEKYLRYKNKYLAIMRNHRHHKLDYR